MANELSNTVTIFLLYLFIFLKYVFFSEYLFDIQFFVSNLLMLLLTLMNLLADRLSDKLKDIGKFLGHTMFISVCFSVVSGFISLIYNIVFVYGFVNTIVAVYFLSTFLMSSIINMFARQLIESISQSNIGSKFLDLLNYYYNTYIVSKKIYERVKIFLKKIARNYVLFYCKIIMNKFIKINNELSDNQQSKLIKSKIDNKCSSTKNYIIEQIVQPYFIRSFQAALEKDVFEMPFNPNMGLYTNNKIDTKIVKPIGNQYKTTLPSNNIDMNFLGNNKIIDDSMDDLDDNDTDLDNSLKVSEEQIKDAEKLDNELNRELSEKSKELTPEEKKNALRKKVAEKKAARTAGRGQQAKQNMSNIMAMPGMNEMFETMLQGDNLEKIMKQMPQNNVSMQMPNIDANQMKQIMRSINKKK